eukprot:CAMPEP_0176444184 /NCGR_PEP_ID=MMETSP0127-20121128/22907_1 /TAXON_ID=938130 /ORGANISM="Platyophrya macrostoma, Strain WH" /LENGTH=147 /DNA_ID=CAMNT_0017829635 /DNA_START=38 /DNA_END=481 /DNA_ORIENTATION=+
MAPPKASIPARLLAGDFLNFNWNKVGWMAPYNNFYPITMCGGWGGRFWSNFLQYGHFHNRCNRIVVRNCILAVPSAFMAFVMIFNVDWYQLMQCVYFVLGQPLPQWAEDKHAEELVHYSWFKPGQMAKHHYAGMVSIPGSEAFVNEI